MKNGFDDAGQFQNCVILDSNETIKNRLFLFLLFQNCVILDSNETDTYISAIKDEFQNCVILDSNETKF